MRDVTNRVIDHVLAEDIISSSYLSKLLIIGWTRLSFPLLLMGNLHAKQSSVLQQEETCMRGFESAVYR